MYGLKLFSFIIISTLHTQSSLKSPFFIKSDLVLANTLCKAASSKLP
nr:MAG TPA: hypothetical protein [Crassvirales sp.]